MLLDPNSMSIYLASSLIGFSAGTAVSILLFVLTMRARKLPGTWLASIVFALCSLAWNLGGLAHAAVVTLGAADQGHAALILLAVQFTAAAAWPITVFALWAPLVNQPKQRRWFRSLQILSVVSCVAIATPLWYGALAGIDARALLILKQSTAYNGSILLILGIALFRERLVSRTMRLPSVAMLAGVFGATSACVIQQLFPYDQTLCYILAVLSEQLTLFIVLGAFFLFARFQFSDLFIRYSLRIILGALIALAFAMLSSGVFPVRPGSRAAFPLTARIFAATLAAFPMLFLFAFADRHLGRWVERWIFRAPDYRALLRHLSNKLTSVREQITIAQVIEDFTRQALDLKAVRLIGWDDLLDPELLEAIRDEELVELGCHLTAHSGPELTGVELLVPVRTEGRVSRVMTVTPGHGRRGLVTHELNFLRSVASQLGLRLDALRLEELAAEAQTREALLQQQITEAELRALRAQINPHFLFNSLNSIANLVVTDPEKAETMTLRLARVFRHVLANSARPLVALSEEIAFLETYLQIEEARFGDRLHVQIAIDPAVAAEPIPSLILQPIVENALKHGLSPKVGPGHLWITADTEGDRVRLRVEDDGVGPPNARLVRAGSGRTSGVGLENVALRLNALYQDQSRITLETRKAGGTLVTILLPRETALTA